MNKIFIHNSVGQHKEHANRGVGRYINVLQENIPSSELISKIEDISSLDIFINPYFDLFGKLTPPTKAKKNILVIHDLIPLKFPKYFNPGIRGKINFIMNKKIVQKYSHIVTDSEASKDDIVKLINIPRNKIFINYPPISHNLTEVKNFYNKKMQSCKDYFIYVGDANWHKNLINIAKSAIISNVKIIFVGKVFLQKPQDLTHPWQNHLKKFLEIAHGHKLFIFPGFVSDTELASLYKGAVANLLLSHAEGFGYSYFEAAHFQTPSILSDINIFHEMAGNNAIFVKQNLTEEISQAMLKIKHNQKLREAIGEAAQSHCAKINSQEKFKKFWENLVKS